MAHIFSPKFLILLIFIIILLGTAATSAYSYLTGGMAKQLLNFTPSQTPLTTTTLTLEPVSLALTLSHPEDNKLVFDQDLLIQGKSSPLTSILVSLKKDQVLTTDQEGNFSITVQLEEGTNNLVVAAFDKSGNIKQEERIIYYSKEKL